ncbi:MAG: hypothetical protein GXP18_10865 [Gammaproteobacteria bacterium]|nr:hypothetical protein [Gammaproteobacteria bacterium]
MNSSDDRIVGHMREWRELSKHDGYMPGVIKIQVKSVWFAYFMARQNDAE